MYQSVVLARYFFQMGHMCPNNTVLYIPFTFCYVGNYSPGSYSLLSFMNVPFMLIQICLVAPSTKRNVLRVLKFKPEQGLPLDGVHHLKWGSPTSHKALAANPAFDWAQIPEKDKDKSTVIQIAASEFMSKHQVTKLCMSFRSSYSRYHWTFQNRNRS